MKKWFHNSFQLLSVIVMNKKILTFVIEFVKMNNFSIWHFSKTGTPTELKVLKISIGKWVSLGRSHHNELNFVNTLFYYTNYFRQSFTSLWWLSITEGMIMEQDKFQTKRPKILILEVLCQLKMRLLFILMNDITKIDQNMKFLPVYYITEVIFDIGTRNLVLFFIKYHVICTQYNNT